MEGFDRLFVLTAFSLQGALLLYFVWRRLDFERALKYGWLLYTTGFPAVFVSIATLLAGNKWYFWLGGFLFGIWAFYGYRVDIIQSIRWRNPIYPPVFVPYVTLFLAAQMLYWWPLGAIRRSLWFAYAGLFLLATYFNWTSHARQRLQ